MDINEALLTIGAVSMVAEFSPQRNVAQICDTIRSAVRDGVGLLVFPECAVQGYPLGLGKPDVEQVEYQARNAETIPGPATEAIVAAIGVSGIVVVVGLTECPNETLGEAGLLFDTSVVIASAGVIAKYRKVHTGGPEKGLWTRGNDFVVTDTSIGRLGLLVCYDLVFPEAARALALAGAEILVLSTAWARAESETFARGYDLFTRSRALENQLFLVSANLVDGFDPGFHGHSRIVDPTGCILAESVSLGIARATINLREDIVKLRARSWFGQVFLRDRAPGSYGLD